MARHYYESDLVPVAELSPGAELVQRRVVVTVVRSAAQAVLTFDDGTTQTFELGGDPAVEVVTAGLQ